MQVSEQQVRSIVRNVLNDSGKPPSNTQVNESTTNGWGVFTSVEDAVKAAQQAYVAFRKFDLQDRNPIIEAMRQVGLNFNEQLSRGVFEETGMGRYEDKLIKHENAALQTPGVEDLKSEAWSGENGLAVEEYAPFGVIGSVTPSTHPSETIISNAILMLAAGNTVVFGPHPSAKRISALTVQLCNQAIVRAGGPENCLTTIAEPTIESAGEMFKHKDVALLSITGGPGVVRAAMKSNKKVIAAGPGNPPVVIDETADLDFAAKMITRSASFDNNILCTAEKEIFVVESVFNGFMQSMIRAGNKQLTSRQMDVLASKVFEKKKYLYLARREFVGRNASVLARQLDMSIAESVPLLFGETPADHLFVIEEQLMPCMPVVRVRNFEEGVRLAIKAEHNYRHTMSVFTQNMNHASQFARRADCSIFVINGGTYQGDGGEEGEGTLSFTIATPTGEAVTRPRHFARVRRIMTAGSLRFV